MTQPGTTGLELRSLAKASGELELSLLEVPVPEPSEREVLVRIEAAPVNPSDLGLLIGPADPATARASGSGKESRLSLTLPPGSLAGRLDLSMAVGNEGAGTVIAAGASPEAQALIGRTVAMIGGAMYAEVRCIDIDACLPLPEGMSAAEGAASFVNPMTALGMVETMRREGHTALVHTAAASNLGQMLNRVCLEDGIGLVNIVRKPEQVELLRGLGATHVCDTSQPAFEDDLRAAVAATGATLGFDAIGGGRLAGQILSAMEAAASEGAAYSRYGSTTPKQVYIYGGLDTGPTVLERSFGMTWGVGGWLLFPFLQKLGPEDTRRLRDRVAAGLRTTFASHFSKEITLTDLLRPDVLAAVARRATGDKYLLRPNG